MKACIYIKTKGNLYPGYPSDPIGPLLVLMALNPQFESHCNANKLFFNNK